MEESLKKYTKNELIEIAKKNGIDISNKMLKKDIIELLIVKKIKVLPLKKKFNDIEDLMRFLDIIDAKDLVNLRDDEIEELINELKIFKGKISVKDYLKDYKGSERVKQLLVILAEKFCRCLKEVENKEIYKVVTPTAICSKSIFSSKGLKGPGRSFQCSPKPLLLPSRLSKLDKLDKLSEEYKEARYVLKKK